MAQKKWHTKDGRVFDEEAEAEEYELLLDANEDLAVAGVKRLFDRSPLFNNKQKAFLEKNVYGFLYNNRARLHKVLWPNDEVPS